MKSISSKQLRLRIYTFAIDIGQLKILKWYSKNYKIKICSLPTAVNFGQLKVLRWLLKTENDLISLAQLKEKLCNSAASNGRLNILKWGCDNGYELNKITCIAAAYNGHLEILKWLIEDKNVVCNNRQLICLYSINHPHIQAYLHGLPLEKRCCDCVQ
jgi:hypothetical protein